MKWLNFFNENDYSNYNLIIPSCGCSNIDQLTIDLLCFKYGKLIGRIISDQLDFVVSPNPYKKDDTFSSSIDVYSCEIPRIGLSIVLRVASSLPNMKRRIFDYSKEILEFINLLKLKEILLIRSVSSVFCIDSQIKDWPFAVRGNGLISEKLKIIPFEQYSDGQNMLKLTIFGDLYRCLEKNSKIPLSLIVFFVNEGKGYEDAIFLFNLITQIEIKELPYSWIE